MQGIGPISVVDDDQSMTRMLARALGFSGFEVSVFHSAEEFLASHQMTRSTFLVLDVDLPGMSGLDLQTRLSEIGSTTPIIFISGNASEEIRQKALNAGAVGFLAKPFGVEALLEAVRSSDGLAQN